MKKAFCLLLAVLSLVAVFMMPISAASTSTKNVMKDLSTLKIDGKQFEAADYPRNANDKNLYLLTVVEQNFQSFESSRGYRLYLYVYNPSCHYFTNSFDDSAQIGLNMDCKEYGHYAITIESRSGDDRFLRIQVTDPETSEGGKETSNHLFKNNLYVQQTDKETCTRVYNFVALHLAVNGKIEPFALNSCYMFSGYDWNDTITCSTKDLKTHQIELYHTNWISPNAKYKVATSPFGGKIVADGYDHYELASVYFKLPKSILEDGYKNIVGFSAKFEKLHLTPILVVDEDRFLNEEYTDTTVGQGDWTKTCVLNAYPNIPSKETSDVYDFVAASGFGALDVCDWVYTNSLKISDWWCGQYGAKLYTTLAYYFDCEKLRGVDFGNFGDNYSMLAVSDKTLRDYYYSQLAKGISKNVLYSSRELCNVTYKPTATDMGYNLTSFVHDISKWEKFLMGIQYDNCSYIFEDYGQKTVDYFTVLNSGSSLNPNSFEYYYGKTSKDVADALYIGENDVQDFLAVCRDAGNDEMVVILRFAFSDYRCIPLLLDDEDIQTGTHQVGFAIDKYAYRNVNVYETIVCATDGTERTIPLVSNTIDVFGDLVIFENPKDEHPLIPDIIEQKGKDWWETFLKILKWVGIALLVLVLLPVLIWILGKIFGFGDKVSDFTRERIERAKQRKAEKEEKKNGKKTE